MNPSVSLLAPGGPALPAAGASQFPERATCDRDAAPFSSVLARAVQQSPPPQKNSAPKSVRAKTAESEDSAQDSLGAERRSPVREKKKREARDDDQSLAGACAVNGQPVKPEEPGGTGNVPVEATAEAAQTSAAPAAAASVSGVEIENGTTGSLATGTAVVATEAKATTTAAAGVTAPTPTATATSSTTAIVQTIEDLTKQLTPRNGPSLESVAVKPTPTTPTTPITPTEATNNPTMAKELTPGVAVAPTLLSTGEATDQSSSGATATSARAAEVLLAAGLETDASTPTPEPTTLVADAATTTEVPDMARRVARAARRAWTDTLENARGIGAAKISETMKTAIKKEEVAGVAQQMLPGAAAVGVSALPTLPGEARRSSTGAVSPAEALSLAGKLTTTPARADGAGVENLRDTRPVSPLARVSELISREVRMFKRAGDDLVEVVLTPDAKTQISLRLQWREGQVEVQARCDLGDYQSLSTQWTQLQTTMAQHGVRLSHLTERATTGFTEFFNNPSFAQSHGGDRRPPTPTHSADPLAPNGSQPAKPAPAKSAGRGNRLFDSWA